MKIILAKPMGFCAGVKRAVDILELVLAENKNHSIIYSLHEIVHNKSVVDYFISRGVVFVNDINIVPDGSIVVLSAHGVPLNVREIAAKKNLCLIDATCPLVTKVHTEIKNFASNGMSIVVLGDKNHPEVIGTIGQVPNVDVEVVYSDSEIEALEDKENVAYVTQTTISTTKANQLISKLNKKFPNISRPTASDICYATQNRQNAIAQMAKIVDALIVIGSPNSSNSNQLRKIGIELGIEKSFLVSSRKEIDLSWFDGISTLGVTAGASAPDSLLKDIISFLQISLSAEVDSMEGKDENVSFRTNENEIKKKIQSRLK